MVPPEDSYWIDDGFDTVSTGSSTTLGVVKGSDAEGDVAIRTNGTMVLNGYGGLEKTTNKTQTLDAQSTHVQYPTAKTVHDALADKEDTANKTATIAAPATASDTKYPSEKAVATALADKENTSNKVLSLSSTSTDIEYPTAKAVYDAIAAATPKGTRGRLLSDKNTRTQDYANGDAYTVPSYIVGNDQLDIYWNGLHCAPTQEYSEVGTVGQPSTTITILIPTGLEIRDVFNVFVRPQV
jgi:hypothetical protein